MDLKPDILKVKNLTKNFGGLAAVSNCSLNIKKGSIALMNSSLIVFKK